MYRYRIDVDDQRHSQIDEPDAALDIVDALTQAHGPERVQAFAYEGGWYREHPSGDAIDCSGWSAIDRVDLVAEMEAEERHDQDARVHGWVA
jgi:hypothetical protein